MPRESAELSASQARDSYRELFERSADAILIIEDSTFIDCNDAAVEMLRYKSREEVLQTHPSELSPPFQPDGRESFEKANEYMGIAFDRGSHRFEWDHIRADGEVFPVEVLLTAVREPGRRTLHVVWRDITERKRLEEELRQAQKMEAIGKLTGGIAHDFNNLLVAILGHADLLLERVEHDPEGAEHLREIRSASDRAAGLVRQLLAFGRKQQLLPVTLNLNELASDMQKLLKRVIGEDVSLVTKLSDEAVLIKADRSQIEQVLMNLAANARDAMPEGGELRIETSCVLASKLRDANADAASGADHAVLSVSDDGSGMDAATLERAFDPFFTTKEVGRGTGLGLATVYGVVKQSGGRVSLHSVPGHGTRVEISLPLVGDAAVEAQPNAALQAQRVGEGETVLVIEDERSVAHLVQRALSARGYRVILCRDGEEALGLFAKHEDEIALVLSDVIMPKLSGPKLIAELRRRGHSPRVLFMSGYTADSLLPLEGEDEVIDVLEKPFDVSELVRRVQGALQGR